MSSIAEPPATPAPAAPVPAAPKGPVLPSGIKIDNNYDAGEHFAKHQAENPKPGQAAPAAPVAPVAPVAPAAPMATPEKPEKAELGNQIIESLLPASAKKPDVVPPAAPVAHETDDPIDKTTLDAKYSPAAHEQFNLVKASRREIRDKLAVRERELAETRAELEKVKSGAAPVETPELLKLREEHAAMGKRLMVLDLQSHPDFQREFVAPRSVAETEARNILEAHGVDADIDALLNKDPVEFRKGLSAIAAKLPTALDQSDFAQVMRQAHGLRLRANDAITKAGDLGKALREKTMNGYKASFENTFQRVVGAQNIKELTLPPGEPPETVAVIDSYNSAYRGLRAQAEKIALGASNPDDISSASVKAALYDFQMEHAMPILQRALKARADRCTQLEGELAAIKARNPNRDIRGVPGAGGGVDPSTMDHHAAAEHFANLGRGG